QVLQEYFNISPISEAQEGAQVTVPAGYSPDRYRLVGKLTGEPPFTGTLLHKGWKTEFVKLPRIATREQLPSIAPAEVELKCPDRYSPILTTTHRPSNEHAFQPRN